MVQRVFGICEAKNGTGTDELLQAEPSVHKRVRQDAKTNSDSGSKKGQKRRTTRKEQHIRLWNDFEMGGFTVHKGLWNLAREKMLQDRGALPKEEGDIVRQYKAMHEEKFMSSRPREDVDTRDREWDRND